MPPAFEDLSDASDDIDELPPKKPQPKKAANKSKALPKEDESEDEVMEEVENGNGAENDDDEDDDDEEAEEYVVEKILNHDFEVDGTVKYEVKWLGYEAKDDCTWEPEENLSSAPDVLSAYFKKIGGRPEFKSKKTATKGRGKRKSVPATTSDVGTSAKRGRRSKTSETTDVEPAFKLPEGSWEDHVEAVESIEQVKEGEGADGGQGGLHVFLQWNDGHKSFHPTAVIRRKCPQKLISFYESKLVFKTQHEGDAETA